MKDDINEKELLNGYNDNDIMKDRNKNIQPANDNEILVTKLRRAFMDGYAFREKTSTDPLSKVKELYPIYREKMDAYGILWRAENGIIMYKNGDTSWIRLIDGSSIITRQRCNIWLDLLENPIQK